MIRGAWEQWNNNIYKSLYDHSQSVHEDSFCVFPPGFNKLLVFSSGVFGVVSSASSSLGFLFESESLIDSFPPPWIGFVSGRSSHSVMMLFPHWRGSLLWRPLPGLWLAEFLFVSSNLVWHEGSLDAWLPEIFVVLMGSVDPSLIPSRSH